MAKTDWSAVAAAYERDKSKTGISAQEWCEKRGINYASARRYLKSRGQSPDKPDTFQAAAEIAQKKLRKTTKNCAIAQTATNAQKRKSSKVLRKDVGEQQSTSSDSVKRKADRDEAGLFAPGNRVSVGCPGNPSPTVTFQAGNATAKTHGGYAKLFADQSAFEVASELSLLDELRLCRARAVSVSKALNNLSELLAAAITPEEKVELYDKMLKAETALERNISRVESIERTLSSLRVDDAAIPKIEADTDRIRAATRKLTAEANRLEREEGGDATPVSEMLAELQDMGTGGLMS